MLPFGFAPGGGAECFPSSYNAASAAAVAEGKVLAEYVWLGLAGALRSRTKVLDGLPVCVEELPSLVVSDEGQHHGQSIESTAAMDIVLCPRKMFKDPFRGGDHLLVLCDPFMAPQVHMAVDAAKATPALEAHPNNMRVHCESMLAQAEQEQPMFAVEQEYWVQDEDWAACPGPKDEPHGAWPHAHLPDPCKPHMYGPMGEVAQTIPAVRGVSLARAAAARKLSETHLHCCLKAGLKVTSNGEGSQPGLWSYKLGPMPGTELGDQLWMSRHLLIRLAEAMCVPLTFNAAAAGRPVSCFFKYSTLSSRRPDVGVAILQQHLGRLQASHVQHMLAYGLAKSPDDPAAVFAAPPACAVCNSNAPLCIPISTALNRCGHIVDRRPTANADPWAVVMMLVSTTLGLALPNNPSASRTCSRSHDCSTQHMVMADVVVNAIQAAQLAAVANALNNNASHQPGLGCVMPSMKACGQPAANVALMSEDISEGVSGCSWGCDSVPESLSLNTEDVLLQELDRMDGVLPDAAVPHAAGARQLSACGSCCSDGTSPDNDMDDACSQPFSVCNPPLAGSATKSMAKQIMPCVSINRGTRSKRARSEQPCTYHSDAGCEGATFSCAVVPVAAAPLIHAI